jgi:hypothetical protein
VTDWVSVHAVLNRSFEAQRVATVAVAAPTVPRLMTRSTTVAPNLGERYFAKLIEGRGTPPTLPGLVWLHHSALRPETRRSRILRLGRFAWAETSRGTFARREDTEPTRHARARRARRDLMHTRAVLSESVRCRSLAPTGVFPSGGQDTRHRLRAGEKTWRSVAVAKASVLWNLSVARGSKPIPYEQTGQ